MPLNPSSKIYIAGHRGLVGGAIHKLLKEKNFSHLICRSKEELDLREQKAVFSFFEKERPEYVVLAAAKVGGIHANQTYPAHFIYDNLAIQQHVIHAAYLYGVKRLIFLGSACIYPRETLHPIQEHELLSGPLEATNEAYAIAKIAGFKLCESYYKQYGCDFLGLMPTNLYGPGDNFSIEQGHVIPGLMRKFQEAKEGLQEKVEVWGTGEPLREFLHSEDMADAIFFLLQQEKLPRLINVGSGIEISIKELAQLIKKIVGYGGDIFFNENKPNGVSRRCLDNSILRSLGWESKIPLEKGLTDTYQWFLHQQKEGQRVRGHSDLGSE